MTLKHLVQKRKRTEAAYIEARDRFDAARLELQLACDHADIAEVDYIPSDYGNSTPPWRVCRVCGFAEQGWSCGYKILQGEAVRIAQNEGYRARVGLTHPNHRFLVCFNDPPGTTKQAKYEAAIQENFKL